MMESVGDVGSGRGYVIHADIFTKCAGRGVGGLVQAWNDLFDWRCSMRDGGRGILRG